MTDADPVAVLGGGSWGTALAWLLCRPGSTVRLWARDPAQVRALIQSRENKHYLPGLTLPASVLFTADPAVALDGARAVIIAVPSDAVGPLCAHLRAAGGAPAGMLLAAKGLERGSGRRLSQVVQAELGAVQVAVLSGPNLAREVVQLTPTASVIASEDPDWSRELQVRLGTPVFRIYTNTDLAGVELAGALKNPLAIAAGISDGLGYGANTRAALLTRGLAEMVRLGVAAGGRASTFSGLAGLGDLMATAGSPLSRNYRVGLALGRGDGLAMVLAALGQVAEGVPTTAAACLLAHSLGVEVPILAGLRRVLDGGASVQDAVVDLLARPFREEA